MLWATTVSRVASAMARWKSTSGLPKRPPAREIRVRRARQRVGHCRSAGFALIVVSAHTEPEGNALRFVVVSSSVETP